jgi:hypothetical protein
LHQFVWNIVIVLDITIDYRVSSNDTGESG